MKPPVGLRLSNCLSCLARSSEVMAHMFGPPGKKTTKQIKQKTNEQPNGLKTFKNKARHLQNKILAFSRDKVRRGHTQLLPVWQGRYATQTCFPDVQAELSQSPSQTASPWAFKQAVALQSWCRAASCGC